MTERTNCRYVKRWTFVNMEAKNDSKPGRERGWKRKGMRGGGRRTTDRQRGEQVEKRRRNW